MALEIERRFLIKNEHWRKYIIDQYSIEQGYFSSNSKEWVIRIRLQKERYKLTIKKHISSFTNYEFEYDIPIDDGLVIMSNLQNKVTKERYLLAFKERKWIVDCFKNGNYPLKIAEIELNNEKDNIIVPDFVGREITGMKNLSNFNLSKKPISKWSKEKLIEIKNY
tara:strand:- start:617 stop:1114 length:498 start_codon:yes stop_codon:yes gene_type:complete